MWRDAIDVLKVDVRDQAQCGQRHREDAKELDLEIDVQVLAVVALAEGADKCADGLG